MRRHILCSGMLRGGAGGAALHAARHSPAAVWSNSMHLGFTSQPRSAYETSVDATPGAGVAERPATAVPAAPRVRRPLRSAPHQLLPSFTHPVVLLDPRPVSVLLVRRLRAQGVPVAVLTSRRLEPAFYARGVRRAFLPGLSARPEAWIARLLEWAAHLEPRPLAWPCSWSALQWLLAARDSLEPHYELAHAAALQITRVGTSPPADVALRRAILRSEPALEVQLTLDRASRVTGKCVLAWSPSAAPDVVVASGKADDLVQRSHHWLADQDYHGYVRLIWSPDRFGRLALQAASPFPGIGLALALQDGVDFSRLAYASITGMSAAPETARGELVRRVAVAEPGVPGETLPLVEYRPSWSGLDPLPWCVGVLAQLVRR